MLLKIFLDITNYDCLREHLFSESMLRSCPSAAVMLVSNIRIVDCDEMQVREVLVIARNHCTDAVRKINGAMLMAG
jgi:hypothetical protein